jgi:MarR family transcriptional regulator for hemolysin
VFNLDDCMAFIANRSAKIFAEALEKEFRPYNMTRSQWIAMYYIYTSDSITQRELADKMSIKEPSVVRLLQKLETDGLLLRSGTQADRRVKQLQLSDKGVLLYLDLLPVVEKFKDDIISNISEKDLQAFKHVLGVMVENALKE